MNWIKALDTDALPEGEREVVRLEGKQVLLINHEGTLYAVANRCPHMGYPLKAGRIDEDCALHCPFHRSAFDLGTGDVMAWSPWPPGGIGVMLGKLSREKTLDIYDTRVKDGAIWVGFEQPS